MLQVGVSIQTPKRIYICTKRKKVYSRYLVICYLIRIQKHDRTFDKNVSNIHKNKNIISPIYDDISQMMRKVQNSDMEVWRRVCASCSLGRYFVVLYRWRWHDKTIKYSAKLHHFLPFSKKLMVPFLSFPFLSLAN